jgi:hypothetical protein
MRERRGSRNDPHRAGRYEIRVNGHLDGHWAAWFDGLSLKHEDGGRTVIHGWIADQAALHGLLQQLRDLGMSLVSLNRVQDDDPDSDTERKDTT